MKRAIEQVGEPLDVYNMPVNAFVAGFIGSPAMNMLPLDWLAERGSGPLPALPDGTDLVGIRPDDLLIERPEEPVVAIPATLDLVEPAGGETHLYLGLEAVADPVTLRVQGRPDQE